MNENVMVTSDMWPYAASYGTGLSNYISNQANDKMLDVKPIQLKSIIESGIRSMVNQQSKDI